MKKSNSILKSKSYLEELNEVIGPPDPELEKEIEAHFDEIERREKWMEENNIPQEMRKYYFDLEALRKAGFTPVAVTTMMCENTFVFATDEEAGKAYMSFEVNPKHGVSISGWWHSRESLGSAIAEYLKEFESEPIVIWL